MKKSYLLLLIIILTSLLRFIWLDKIPVHLYSDEANLGYNAYSILKTGADEHGVFLPVSLRSFGDWKPPLQSYLMIPFMAVFGVNEWSIRLPSALLGVISVILVYFFVKKLGKNTEKLALLAAFLLAVSPWHVSQSRMAMLVMVALVFFQAGILFFTRIKSSPKNIALSSLFFALSIYAYYGMRVVIPLVILFLAVKELKTLKTYPKQVALALFVFLVVLLPLFLTFLLVPDVIFGRARTVSVFYDEGTKLRQWELITQDGVSTNPFISRLSHNIIYRYTRNITGRFLSHFDSRFLFLKGDTVQPFGISNMGLFHIQESILIVIGVFFLVRGKYKYKSLIPFWIVISVIPASLTFLTPSSNRSFIMVAPLIILAAYGLKMINCWKKSVIASCVLSIFYAGSLYYFLYQYFQVMPHQHASWFNWGWKQVADYVLAKERAYDNIVVFDEFGMPYIYFLLYGKYEPAKYQKEAIRTYVADRFGFEHVEGFGKYLFPNDWQWKYVKDNRQPKTLYVVPAQQAKPDINYSRVIYYPDQTEFVKIFE